MTQLESRPFFTTSATAALLILGLTAPGLHAQLTLPADFRRALAQRGIQLDLELLADFEVVPVIANPHMEYDIGLRSPSGLLEVRYAFRDDPGANSANESMALATLLNVGSDPDAASLGPFPEQAVRTEFNAAAGVSSSTFVPRPAFSSEHDSGLMAAIWDDGRGMVFAFYLFNESEREAALNEWRSVFYAHRFRR